MPIIPPQEHRTYQEWLYLEIDGELSSAERSELARHLEGCGECRAERRAVARLERELVAARIEVDPALERDVLSNLPAAGWEARSPKAWKWAVACVVLLAASAVVAGRGAETAAPVAGTVAAVADLFATTAVAGAGLLSASWQGLGLALGELFGGSKLTLGVFTLFVLGLDVLFVRFLLRGPSKKLAAEPSTSSGRRAARRNP